MMETKTPDGVAAMVTGDRASIISILGRIPLFAGVPAEKLTPLAGAVVPRRAQPGERIVRAGEQGDSFFYILAGKVKVTRKLRNGDETILSILGPGQFFGEQALLDGQPRSASVYAVDHTVLLVLLREELLRFLTADPSVAINIIIGLSERVRRLNQQLDEAYTMEMPQRVARRLHELVEKHSRQTPGGLEIDRALTVAELAQAVGSPLEQVKRVLAVWQQRGVIRVSWDGEIVVLEQEALSVISRLG